MIKKLKTIFKITILSFLFAGLIGSNVLAFQQPIGDNEKTNVLIAFYERPGLLERALLRSYDGEIYRDLDIVNVVAARLTSRSISALVRHPRIKYIEPDFPVYALEQQVPWGIDRVFGDEAYSFSTWETTRGEGIAVAILDTGIEENHQDLYLNILGGTNTIDSTHWGSDGHGHGTHVAGTVAALDNDLGVVGVGPKIGLYAIKVLNDSGSGTISSVVAGISWAVEQNIPILNMSLGSSSHSQALQDAVDRAYQAGHLLVAAAGNSGNRRGTGSNVNYPARYNSVISVAASDGSDNRASFSSTGPEVELIAPGVSVLSAWKGNSYREASGTSMASPHAAGAAALVWAANPNLTNFQVRETLQQTAQNLGLSSNHQGYGLVRADLAVGAVAGVEPPMSYTITSTVGEGGTIDPSGEVVVYEGEDQTFAVIPDAGYEISEVLVDDYSVGPVESYTFENVTNNHTIYATFELIPTYRASGMVSDTEGNALEGATVLIVETNQSTMTGSNGAYEISDVEKGTYNIAASKQGYTSQTKTVVVNEDIAVDFSLEEITQETMYINSIVFAERRLRSFVDLMVTVEVLRSSDSQPVSNTRVEMSLSHERGSWNFAGNTKRDGKITFTLRRAYTGDYTSTVTALTHDIYLWDVSQGVTSAQYTVE